MRRTADIGAVVPFGLESLPAAISPDDPRLGGIRLTAAPLRLNTMPLSERFGGFRVDHATRLAIVEGWLCGLCGDYAVQRRRFVSAFLAFAAVHLRENDDELAERSARYDALFAPEDWFWSALRPLPGAWIPVGTDRVRVDVAFWTGQRLLAVIIGHEPMPPALAEAGVAAVRFGPEEMNPDAIGLKLPETRFFWTGETLPSSPFRRSGDALRASSP